ncbi:hypothetical protein H4R33_002017 [Dimargaris cristalligena]|uniref:G-patch domain-containing protein n=1 Tax=Dimargaris cristalligena TaxID=215637 RepID=A0A4P9ZLK5_9FUNG|nr:hypothetical protein H4R33_002017 [Dimargaris cristalligena]RKP34023.1 hypothetical protein BJ085DRAFT_27584 [Dimargaris cristalligena]|eukprot:RKP34023.1 hypothetical protein BJ085DRAFT_27584 [Dimargaris cristalligena]
MASSNNPSQSVQSKGEAPTASGPSLTVPTAANAPRAKKGKSPTPTEVEAVSSTSAPTKARKKKGKAKGKGKKKGEDEDKTVTTSQPATATPTTKTPRANEPKPQRQGGLKWAPKPTKRSTRSGPSQLVDLSPTLSECDVQLDDDGDIREYIEYADLLAAGFGPQDFVVLAETMDELEEELGQSGLTWNDYYDELTSDSDDEDCTADSNLTDIFSPNQNGFYLGDDYLEPDDEVDALHLNLLNLNLSDRSDPGSTLKTGRKVVHPSKPAKGSHGTASKKKPCSCPLCDPKYAGEPVTLESLIKHAPTHNKKLDDVNGLLKQLEALSLLNGRHDDEDIGTPVKRQDKVHVGVPKPKSGRKSKARKPPPSPPLPPPQSQPPKPKGSSKKKKNKNKPILFIEKPVPGFVYGSTMHTKSTTLRTATTSAESATSTTSSTQSTTKVAALSNPAVIQLTAPTKQTDKRNSKPPPTPSIGYTPLRTGKALDQSNAGHRLLSKMGWTEGTGLGANKQGITEPVPVNKWNRRQGLN